MTTMRHHNLECHSYNLIPYFVALLSQFVAIAQACSLVVVSTGESGWNFLFEAN